MPLPTLVPYQREFPLDALTVSAPALTAASVLSVTQSLTRTAMRVFRELCALLAPQGRKRSVALSTLLRVCEDKLLAADEATLRRHLHEFVDHKIIAYQRGTSALVVQLQLPRAEVSQILAALDADN